MPTPIPAGYHTVTPALVVNNCVQALEFYKKAFGAQELSRLTAPDGKIAHAEIKIGDSIIFLSDEMSMGAARSPQSLGGTTASLNIYTPDVDAAFERAVKAGAQAKMPPADMFWGDRYGQLTDPYGQVWALLTHKEDLTPQQIEQRTKEFYAKMRAA